MGRSAGQNDWLHGPVGVHAPPDLDGVTALRSFAPLATPISCPTTEELFDRLARGELHWAFIAIGSVRSAALLDIYANMATRDVTIVGEHMHGPAEIRFLLLARGGGLDHGRRFQPDVQAGDLWLDLPVLSQGCTSVLFELPHEPGALVRALGPMSRRHLNVRNLEMRPVQNGRESCMIAAEIDGYAHEQPVKAALEELDRLADSLHVLGAYPAAS